MTLKYEDAVAEAMRQYGIDPASIPQSAIEYDELRSLAPKIKRGAAAESIWARYKATREQKQTA